MLFVRSICENSKCIFPTIFFIDHVRILVRCSLSALLCSSSIFKLNLKAFQNRLSIKMVSVILASISSSSYLRLTLGLLRFLCEWSLESITLIFLIIRVKRLVIWCTQVNFLARAVRLGVKRLWILSHWAIILVWIYSWSHWLMQVLRTL